MCGLVKAEIITNEVLKEHLRSYGYAPENITPGLCTHQDRDTNFTLAVDEFGFKYINKKDTDHLIAAIRAKYKVTQYWTRGIYF